MIDLLPSKYVPLSMSVIGQAAFILGHRHEDQTVSDLWTRVRDAHDSLSFGNFVTSLTLLHALGAVEIRYGLLRWH